MSKKFNDEKVLIINTLTGLLSKDSPKEMIEAVDKVKGSLEVISTEMENQEKETMEMKDLYIKAVKTSGSSDEPKEEITPAEPRGLEEIAKDLLNSK